MTQWPLVLAALALGAASVPHCAVMCAAPCAALTNGAARASVAFHAARAAGYMAGGAVAASSVAALGEWSLAAPALRPVWTLMHLTFLALGAYWVITGRALTLLRREAPLPQVVVVRRSRSLRATIAGLAWVAWPCATLQAALLLAALASDAAGGALVMGSFALASIPGLVALPGCGRVGAAARPKRSRQAMWARSANASPGPA